MNSIIEFVNRVGDHAIPFAGAMFCQSSLLIAALLVIELVIRHKIRPAVRYALWLLVPVKLLLPPALAFPSGVGWWFRAPAPVHRHEESVNWVVRYEPIEPLADSPALLSTPTPSRAAAISLPGWVLVGWAATSGFLLAWMLAHSRRLVRICNGGKPPPPWLVTLLEKSHKRIGLNTPVRLLTVDELISPAVFGLLRQTILIPRVLVEKLSCAELRGTIVHELIHMRRRDVWVNFGQTLVQIVYWWHPLVWLASAQARRAREEAVDDAAMAFLDDEAESYPATLLRVGRLVMDRSLATLGLVGILESRSALRRRIERLTDFRRPRRPGLTLVSSACILGFGALALPMGQAPVSKLPAERATTLPEKLWPDARFGGYAQVKLDALFWQADETSLATVLPLSAGSPLPRTLASNEVARVLQHLERTGVHPLNDDQPPGFAKFSGGWFRWQVGGCTNNLVNYITRETNGRTIVTGAETTTMSTVPEWIPLQLDIVPWSDEGFTRCEMKLKTAANPSAVQSALVTIPTGGATLWATLVEPSTRKYEVVLLIEGGAANPVARSGAGSAASTAAKTDSEAQPVLRPNQVGAAPGTSPAESDEQPRSESRKADEQAVSLLVQRGKLYYDLGKLDEAELALRQALTRAPLDETAHFYLSLISNVRARRTTGQRPRTVDEALALGTPRLRATPPEPYHPETPPLYTRAMKIKAKDLYTVARAILGDRASEPLGAEEMRELCAALGVDLRPPKSVFLSDTGGLLIRATLPELDVFESSFLRLAFEQDQVQIQLSFVKLPAQAAKAFWEQHQPAPQATNQVRRAYLTESEADTQLEQWEAAFGPGRIRTGRVTTKNGRRVEMTDLDVRTYIGPRGVGSISTGPQLDVRPVVVRARPSFSVRMTLVASMTESFGGEDPGLFVPLANTDLDGRPIGPATLPSPRLRRSSLGADLPLSVVVAGGQTVALGGFTPAPPFGATSDSENELILLLTAKVLAHSAK